MRQRLRPPALAEVDGERDVFLESNDSAPDPKADFGDELVLLALACRTSPAGAERSRRRIAFHLGKCCYTFRHGN
jgi:hypothetical protein